MAVYFLLYSPGFLLAGLSILLGIYPNLLLYLQMSNLQKLFEYCQAEVIVFYNGHRSTDESVDEYLKDWGDGHAAKAISQDVYIEMIKRDTVIVIQFYPLSPREFRLVFHYDLEKAAEQALAIL